MTIAPKYSPKPVEDKWYQYWMDQAFFHSMPDHREPYTVVIPPPNVTGVLHMGHMLNNTIQDVLVRRKRMQGYNTLWVPGTDHASIATEAKVVNKLKSEGIEKSSLTREQFLEHAWQWKEKHGGIILEQLKKLGASCDWSRTRFTMDKPLYDSVIKVFIDLYDKGLIYRGVRMVNWDPQALTALSDEEVIHKEVQSKLYYLRYNIEGTDDQYVTIATTRPETILGDTAVCVNPEDERYKDLEGKKVIVPLVNRTVPIIRDAYVDMEFGTGCLKITPAHDINDYEIGIRHKLKSIDIFNDNGTLNEKAELYVGMDRFACRKQIVKDLEAAGNLVKIEDYTNKVGYSERTDAVIEPKLSLQWFLKMEELAKPALDLVMDDTIQFYPAKFKNSYRHWMENVRDWCISRQLWWGQQIPVYYAPSGEMAAAESAEEALLKLKEAHALNDLTVEDLVQDEDVLDTWFSSWLWPITVFDGIRHPDNEEINYYYPTNDLVTAPEILFFWVARMIMAGKAYRGDIPFKNVYLTGIVRDHLGRKMSKSLGNSPDPIMLMEKYGADGVRMGMLLTSPAGNDLPFDETLCEQGRNFTNKVWNALRLVKGWEVDDTLPQPDTNGVAVRWFQAKLNEALSFIEEQFEKYRLSDALMAIYKLIWDDFCSWYLEMIKPGYQQPIDRTTLEATIVLFDKLMRILHPFMPFMTEEVWHLMAERKEGDSIMISAMPQPEAFDRVLLQQFEVASETIQFVRSIRKEKNIPFKEALALFVKPNEEERLATFDPVITKLCNLSEITYVTEKVEDALSVVLHSVEYYIPLAENIDVEAEIAKLEEELSYAKGFLQSVEKKLSNERFVKNAPEKVVMMERKKQEDALKKIDAIESQLHTFRK
ncbi:MAG: valine--tRNA ligase [Bacteroidetes bacterium]|nr:MAG: valine--tRNA ligase [Bacteroidota bacterium]